MSAAILELDALTVAYGESLAVSEVSLAAAPDAITAIIGSNGAGKTTLLKAVAGLVRPRAGSIRFAGEEIAALAPERIVARGLCLVPEGRRLFGSMSVRDNLEIGAYLRRDAAAVARDLERVLGYFPALKERLPARAASLSGGQQQMLAVGRALMAAPRLLMLDEPSIGLAPKVVETIAEILRAISAAGVAILLVEQNAHMALRLSRHAHVIENGRLVASGGSAELARSDFVRTAYLGI